MVLLRLLVLGASNLNSLLFTDLYSLPWFINVSENQGPGTILQIFSFNCSSYTPTPTLELLNVQPPTTFFNPPSLARWQGTYVGKLTLSSSARLDALMVNHYKLQLKFTCGNHVMEGSLSVDVQRDLSHIQCAGQFASPVMIQVPETVTPGAWLYTLLLPGLELHRAQLSIISAQDLPHFPGPFSINEQGWLQAPSQGLLGQARKLQISVSFGKRQSCQGMVMVKVLPAQNITIPENLAPGSEVVQVRAWGVDLRYEILSPVPSPLFSIGHGESRQCGLDHDALELAHTPGTSVSRLQVKAFEWHQLWASAKLNLTMNVRLTPALLPRHTLRSQIPETAPVGAVLNTLTCEDLDSVDATLDYKLWFCSSSNPASLCLYDRVLEVNATLDCDTPGTCFQHAASILVLDGGQPQMTTEVPVLVMVTPINEFSPACAPRTFQVQEDTVPHTLLGSVVGMDMDYPHDNTEYYTSGGPTTFAVDNLSGEVYLLGPLDYEQQRLYRLTVLLIDHGQEQNPNHHRSGSCTITIKVEDVNDHAPECEPPFQELTIYAPLGRSVEVTKAILVHSDLVLGPFWPQQPCTYELLICVADAGRSTPDLSTTATIIVHLVHQRASTVATSTHRTTVRRLLGPSVGWEGWTLEIGLLPSLLGYSSWHFRLAQLLQAPSKPAQALLLNSIQGTEGYIEGFMEAPMMEMSQAPSSIMSLVLGTGRDYLFNTRTGAWCWL
uniref:Cadherin related family member 4 n=1 Tax=Piliocolobus tephrosceles TaxID=591936 RepID=A0A8C9H3D3_9PRIM